MVVEMRNFGSTGLRVTSLGLGSAPLNESSFADGVATVRLGIDAGLTYFDTSPSTARACRGPSTARPSPTRTPVPLRHKVEALP